MITHSPAEMSLEAPYCMDAIIRDIEVTLSNQGTAVIEEANLVLNLEGCGQNGCTPWTERSWAIEIYSLPRQPLVNKPLPLGQTEVALDLGQLPAGSYYLRLEGERVSQAITVVKQ